MLQGDREEILGLPISPLCDRKNTLVAESQIGEIRNDCIQTNSFYLLSTSVAVFEKCQTRVAINLELKFEETTVKDEN